MAGRSVVLVGEDALCLALIRRLTRHAGRGLEEFRCLVIGGSEKVRAQVPRYCNASRHVPNIVLTDLDDYPCPVALLRNWGLGTSTPSLVFRVAVREAESWLLADAPGFASFAGILAKQVPQRPEELADPKQALINLVRRSKNKRIREELVPETGSAVSIGPYYNERMTRFVESQWDPDRAAASSPSLSRALTRIAQLAQ